MLPCNSYHSEIKTGQSYTEAWCRTAQDGICHVSRSALGVCCSSLRPHGPLSALDDAQIRTMSLAASPEPGDQDGADEQGLSFWPHGLTWEVMHAVSRCGESAC